ncbi:MAG TPA: ABC transporter ATP-binding protein, partial [Chloroflexota bacterium]|nr:ABC transporter ATP-binding protein [Chloroflexota bacterium]
MEQAIDRAPPAAMTMTHPTIAAGAPAIRTAGLTKVYGARAVVDDLNLAVPQGTICGFLGPNGAGKSTTIKMLLGLIGATRGTASLFGLDAGKDSLEIRRRVGYLAQEARFYEHMTARETLRFVARVYFRGPAAGIERRIEEMIELVGLEGKADRPVRGFSGGEKQRLGLAQAALPGPDLLILDEPVSALDPLGRRDVLSIMERLRGQTTIFYSTHILDDVQRVSDTVVILHNGRLVAQGPIGTLMGTEGTVYTLTVAGDGRPTRARLASLPFVGGVTEAQGHDDEAATTTLEVTVSDPPEARRELLRAVLADGATEVVAFGPKRFNLEDIFVSLIEGHRAPRESGGAAGHGPA